MTPCHFHLWPWRAWALWNFFSHMSQGNVPGTLSATGCGAKVPPLSLHHWWIRRCPAITSAIIVCCIQNRLTALRTRLGPVIRLSHNHWYVSSVVRISCGSCSVMPRNQWIACRIASIHEPVPTSSAVMHSIAICGALVTHWNAKSSRCFISRTAKGGTPNWAKISWSGSCCWDQKPTPQIVRCHPTIMCPNLVNCLCERSGQLPAPCIRMETTREFSNVMRTGIARRLFANIGLRSCWNAKCAFPALVRSSWPKVAVWENTVPRYP